RQFLHRLEDIDDDVVELVDRHAGGTQGIVLFVMFAGVETLLAYKGGDLRLQVLVGDFLTVVAYALDKEALARREEDRQGVVELGDVLAGRVPGQGLALGQAELQVAANRVDIDGHGWAPLPLGCSVAGCCYSTLPIVTLTNVIISLSGSSPMALAAGWPRRPVIWPRITGATW